MSMLRSYLILNIRSMNDLPVMERWLLKDHAADTMSQIGPILERYCSYRAVPHPPECEPYAPYNWRMTEHWWRELPFAGKDLMDMKVLLAEIWPRNYTSLLGLPSGEARSYQWGGKAEGPHPPVFAYCPARPTEDFFGKGRTLEDGHNLRWVQAIRYPAGVSEAEGEDWFLNVHAKEVCKQPGLKRFVSYKCCPPPTSPFVRINELWYENFAGWRQSVIESPPQYTVPGWAKHSGYPFLSPWVDFVSQFILEAPSDDFKHHLRPYTHTS
jgi:hypothetical protein